MHLPRRRAPPPMFAFSILCLGYVLLSMISTSSNAALDEGSSGVSIERLDPRLDALLGAENLAASFNAVDVLVRGRLWTEGPVFWPSENTLLFSDVRDNAIYSWREEEEEDTEKTKTEKGHGTSSPPGSVVAELVRPSGWLSASEAPMWEPGSNGLALDAFGNLVAAQHGERQIARLPLSEVLGGNNGSGRTFRAVASRFQGKRFNSPNDLAFNPLNGDLWFTDPVYGLEGYDDDPKKELMFQGVFRIPAAAYKEAVEGEPAAAAAAAADCAVTLEVSALSSPNGLAFSPDGETLFVSNSGKEASFWASFAVDRVSGRVVKKKENESDESVNSNNRTCPVSSLSAPSASAAAAALARAAAATRASDLRPPLPSLEEDGGQKLFDVTEELKKARAAGRTVGACDGFKLDERGNVFASAIDSVYVFSPRFETLLGKNVVGDKLGNVAFGGKKGEDLFIAANSRILRVRTRTRGEGTLRK